MLLEPKLLDSGFGLLLLFMLPLVIFNSGEDAEEEDAAARRIACRKRENEMWLVPIVLAMDAMDSKAADTSCPALFAASMAD